MRTGKASQLLIASAALAATSLHATVLYDPDNEDQVGYIAPLELSTTDLAAAGAKAYQPWFDNLTWAGDLVEHTVTAGGAISTSVDLSVSPPDVSGGSNWSARVQLDAQDWDTGRKIITYESGTQIAFRWANLSAATKQSIDLITAANSTATQSPVLNYLRGDRSLESSTLRKRTSVLGDIIHSNPYYVGAPASGYSSASYLAFKASNLNRAPRVYAGANDGMLHAFDAATGNEVYAYIPGLLLHTLEALSVRPHEHRYYVDGGLTASDAQIGGVWRTVLAGGLGAGAKGLFALDVTVPALAGESLNSGDNRKVLWELDAGSDNDLGFIHNPPQIAQLNDGNWYVVTGNGYNSVNGDAVLYLVNIETGSKTKIDTPLSTGANGLSGPALLDKDMDGKADVVYAGDLQGQLWKFDVSHSNPNNWQASSRVTELFDAGVARPIASAPDIGVHPQFGYLVYFGTAGLDDTLNQRIYGIWDQGGTPPTSNLRARTLLDATHPSGESVRVTDDNTIDWSTYTGWQVELGAGERLLTGVQLRGERVQFVATNTEADGDPINWLLELDYRHGGPYSKPVFDLNNDGVLNSSDHLDYNSDGDVFDPQDMALGWKLANGFTSRPSIARITGGMDVLYINRITLGQRGECTVGCLPGFEGGHMDVDTDSANDSGFGDSTDDHTHEYDKKHDVTYVDYFRHP